MTRILSLPLLAVWLFALLLIAGVLWVDSAIREMEAA